MYKMNWTECLTMEELNYNPDKNKGVKNKNV